MCVTSAIITSAPKSKGEKMYIALFIIVRNLKEHCNKSMWEGNKFEAIFFLRNTISPVFPLSPQI